MFKYKDVIFGFAIQSGLLLFLGLVIAVLVQIPFNYRVLHPIFMMLFIVSITEGKYSNGYIYIYICLIYSFIICCCCCYIYLDMYS